MQRICNAMTLAVGALIAGSSLAAPGETVTISDEAVPVAYTQGSIVCTDKIPDQGYGPVPGHLELAEKNLFDRTLRIADTEGFSLDLPDDVNCASLATELAAVPADLSVHRVVTRSQTVTFDHKHAIGELQANLTLTIPVKVHGVDAVLNAAQSWLETYLPAEPLPALEPSFPIASSFDTHIYPQAASNIGLACVAPYQGAEKTELSLGNLAGYDDIDFAQANLNIATKPFDTAADCDDALATLIDKFQAADPGDWGSFVKVERTVELLPRYILDNMGHPACQQIELESLTTEVEGQTFHGSKSFPLQTLELAACLPQ